VGSNPISSTKMILSIRSFSVLPVVGLSLKKPFANYLPTSRASQYKRNRAFFPSPRGVREGSWAPTTSSDSEAGPRDLVGETFVTVSDTAPVLRMVIDNYLKRSGINIKPTHEVDNLAMAMSLIASTGGIGLLPAYAQNFLLSSVTSRPIKGDTPTIELVLGYKKSNESPILKLLLSRLDDLVACVSKKAH
jgi:LysR substrate binding domain